MCTEIGVYGGAFDPFTRAHYNVIVEVLSTQPLGAVWVVPSGDNRYDKLSQTRYAHRFAMCELALEDLLPASLCSKVQVKDFEKSAFKTTAELLGYLHSTFPSMQFRLIVGSDVLPSMHTWHDADQVLQSTPFIVVRRETSSSCICSGFPPHWVCLQCCFRDNFGWSLAVSSISSTETRRRVSSLWKSTPHRGHLDLTPLFSLVSERTARYIERNRLFEPPSDPGITPHTEGSGA